VAGRAERGGYVARAAQRALRPNQGAEARGARRGGGAGEATQGWTWPRWRSASSRQRSSATPSCLRLLPNLLGEDVPSGATDEENVEISRWGETDRLDFEARDHLELGELTDTIDFERAAKVTGAGFYYLKREAALLEQALCAFAAARLLPEGFVPMATPDLARADVLEGIGFAPRGPEKQVYNVDENDLCLVGTAEITVGGYHANEILAPDQLPLRYLGLSHCFRTEAGAHGRESRGLYRVHQFSKAEKFVLCKPEQSAAHHERIRELEEQLLQALEIPYRVVNVCAGDLGAPAAKKYDIEAWMPGRGRYGEVTSCSNCTDYQARRLNIRYREEPKAAPRFVHMLNGTALAVSRTLIAIYENHQRRDGSVGVPTVLQPLMGGIREIPPRP
jgi:seryl-tRNA synthetase